MSEKRVLSLHFGGNMLKFIVEQLFYKGFMLYTKVNILSSKKAGCEDNIIPITIIISVPLHLFKPLCYKLMSSYILKLF